MTGDARFGFHNIKELGEPLAADHAATKNYVDTKADYHVSQIHDFGEKVREVPLDEMKKP